MSCRCCHSPHDDVWGPVDNSAQVADLASRLTVLEDQISANLRGITVKQIHDERRLEQLKAEASRAADPVGNTYINATTGMLETTFPDRMAAYLAFKEYFDTTYGTMQETTG